MDITGERYHVQRLARQSANQLVPVPDDLHVPECLSGILSQDEYAAALRDYHDVLRAVYADIREEPAACGMVCSPIDYTWHGPLRPDESRARKSFLRLPSVLLALAATGESTLEGTLAVDAGKFLNTGKLIKPEEVLRKLTGYGFCFENLPVSGGLKDIDRFFVSFPDNPQVLAVLRAFGHLQNPERMVAADYRDLLSETGRHDQHSLDDILRMLIRDSDRAILRAVHERMRGAGYRCRIQYEGFWAVMKFFWNKSKKETAVFHIERNDDFILNIRPLGVSGYASRFDELSERVRNTCLSSHNCRHCGYCEGGYLFEYGGRQYDKCRFICTTFHFTDILAEDIDSILKILDWELACLADMREKTPAGRKRATSE